MSHMTKSRQCALQSAPRRFQSFSWRTVVSLVRKSGVLSILLVLPAWSAQAWGQARPDTRRSIAGVFATVGGGNTQFPYYADNAAGGSFGAFLQRRTLLGAEVRGGTYPVSAKFTQSPISAGLRVGRLQSNAGRLFPFAYIGGGASRAQESGPTYQPTPAAWARCWQASAGLDFLLGRFSWRVAELSWTRTYTSREALRTPYVSTGIVYRFGRSTNQ